MFAILTERNAVKNATVKHFNWLTTLPYNTETNCKWFNITHYIYSI